MRFVFIAIVCGAAYASDWTRFRGPNGTGISPDLHLPSELDRGHNAVWSQKTPKGNSSPIAANGRIFLSGHEGDDRIVLCFDAKTGAELWRRTTKKQRTEVANPNAGPSAPTPATDGKSVFVFFPEIGLLAYDFDGKEQWRVPIGPMGGVQGLAASPILVEGNVILQIDTPEQAWIAAFDASNGKQVWKTERPIGSIGGYATPSIYKPKDGPAQIIAGGGIELAGYQAKTGERLWWARGICFALATLPLISGDSVYTAEPVASAPPPFSQFLTLYDKNKRGKIQLSDVPHESATDVIYYRLLKSADKNIGNNDGEVTEEEWNNAFSPKTPTGGMTRTRLGGKGDVTSSNVAWKYTKGIPYITAPIVYQNILYLIRSGGILATFDPDAGKLLREERVKDAIGEYYAQPVAGDGKIYFITKEGKVTVIRAGEQWEKISSSDLDE